MKMKKIFTLLLAMVMLFSLAACSGGNYETESNSNGDSSQSMSEESTVPDTDVPDKTQETEPSENLETEDSKILVVYFSATGNTEGVAQRLQTDWEPIFMRLSRKLRTLPMI